MGIFEIIATAGQWGPLVVTVASVIATATPTPKDDRVLRRVVQVVRALALNVGKAKPADEERRKGVKW